MDERPAAHDRPPARPRVPADRRIDESEQDVPLLGRRTRLLLVALVALGAWAAWLLSRPVDPVCATASAPTVLATGGVLGEPAPAAGRRVQLRVLVVTGAGADTGLDAWRSYLESTGAPADVHLLARRPVTAGGLVQGAAGRYAGIVVTATALRTPAGGRALRPAELALLRDYSRRFGVRMVRMLPDAAGLEALPVSGAVAANRDGRLTTEGRVLFPYLAGPLPTGSFASASPSAPPAGATVYVRDRRGAPAVWLAQRSPGAIDIDLPLARGNVATQLMLPSLARWVVGGIAPGSWEPYLTVQVDDVLLANALWNPAKNRTDRRRTARMTAADVRATARWVRRTGLTLDMVFNGHGSPEGAACDPLTEELERRRGDLRFVNHTWRHLDFDDVRSVRTLHSEIVRNLRWAREHGLPVDARELVTGEHSGLRNPRLPKALERTVVQVVASDVTREPHPRRLGPATTVPRHPMEVYYDVATREQQVDERAHRLGRACDTACRRSPREWRRFAEGEGGRLFRLAISNDPRPSYAH